MKFGSWKTPFLFIWRIIIFLPKKLWNAILEPTPRGKLRWAFFGVIILTVIGSVIIYPHGYNFVITNINNSVHGIPVLNQINIKPVQEREFNLGLDLQGGAHLVYQAQLEGLETDDLDVMARLRDRIERRVNALGVSEPLIQVAGQNRLVVELAGVDVETAIDRIGETPLLEFREKNNEPPRELTEEEKIELQEYNQEQLKKAQTAYSRVTSGQESFEDIAKEVSEDLETKYIGGDLGVITRLSHADLYEAVQDTLIGKVYPTILETDKGYYIIRVDDRKADDVEMLVSHVLICYQGAVGCESTMSRDEALDLINKVKQEITVDNFEEKAREYSTDPSVAENGGNLDWISPGMTVEVFENVAKDLVVGAISEPIESDFGFHLIHKKEQRPFGETFIHGIFFGIKVETDFLTTPEPWINTGLSGSNVIDAQLVFHQQTNAPQVAIRFDEDGKKMFADLTKKYVGEQIAIYLDGIPISAPVVQQEIASGEAVITGSFTIEEARELARRLKDGALPVEIALIQQQTVGASLGHESLQKSLTAGVIGLILVAIFMLLYYRLLGVIAILALCVYGVITLMLFKLIGVTLTLSGMAGFLLSIGMAVDANILIFERFKEERKQEKNLIESTQAAFDRAWPSIRDGNISTLITCFFLAWFGTSLVQGFAITLGLGVMVSMFSAIIVTKAFLRLIIAWPIKKWLFIFGSGINPRG